VVVVVLVGKLVVVVVMVVFVLRVLERAVSVVLVFVRAAVIFSVPFLITLICTFV